MRVILHAGAALEIPDENFVNARYFHSWALSIFGKPKVTIVCGGCSGQFSSRQWAIQNDRKVVSCCPFCGKWNRTRLVYEGD